MSQPKRLMVMAGGTGGHVFPGIAVACHLINQGWKVRWLGTANRMEADLVPKYGIKIDFIRISGIRGKNIKEIMLAPINIFNAWRQSSVIIQHFNPDVVLGMGGYVSGPGGLAAWSLGIPVVLHEQNGIAGLTNKWLAKIASKVMQAFPSAFLKAEVVGNPVRVDILALPKPEVRLIGRDGPVRVLVVGGSQGARIFNQIMPQVAEKLGEALVILHQSGSGAQQIVEQAYAVVGQSQHKVTEFIEDIAAAYAWADVVICRSGALTVSEISVAGLPALFVPFQHKDRQQYWNALPLEKVGAAKICEQSKFTADTVVTILSSWNRAILLKMAQRARATAIRNSTELVAEALNLVVKECTTRRNTSCCTNF